MPGGCAAQPLPHGSQQDTTCLGVQTNGELLACFRVVDLQPFCPTECAQAKVPIAA